MSLHLFAQQMPRPDWLMGLYISLKKRGDVNKFKNSRGKKPGTGWAVIVFLAIVTITYLLIRYLGN